MRLVGTDIDGTILPRTGVFSARTIAALGSLAGAGIPLVLATARPPRWIDSVALQLGIAGEAVCANGAVFYDLATRSVVDHIGLPEEALLEVADALRAALPGVILGLETTTGLAIEEGFPARESNTNPREVAPFERMESVRDLTGVKMLALLPGSHPDEMLNIAMPLVGHLLELSHSSVTDPLLELAPLGVSKATGLARLAAHHGVDAADVIVFGDAPNDVPMFEWAGTGYAVGNAHDAVKAVATHATESVDDDGVAMIIEQLVADVLAAREATPEGVTGRAVGA